MNVAFISSRLTEHQIPFCEAMAKRCKQFSFIQMMKMPDTWEGKGGVIHRSDYPYVMLYAENEAACRAAIENADALIVSVPYQSIVKSQMQKNTPTFFYLERFFKKKSDWKQTLKIKLGSIWHYRVFEKYKPNLLCASGFCAQDAAELGLFHNRCYQWGYYPELHSYRPEELLSEKKHNAIKKILWVGRLIDWKHPDDVILLAKGLKESGLQFTVHMIGTGYMENELREMIEKHGLKDTVFLLGAKSPQEVRTYMENANVCLSTSDHGEGWGAVINEAMNSGCAVVASHAAGAVPFLIKDGENGFVYQSGNVRELTEKVKRLLQNEDLALQLGKNAYETIRDLWNAEVAAERLITLIKTIKDRKEDPQELFADGPCSKAETIEDEWYHS